MTEQQYRIEFIVKAQKWPDVVQIFNNELAISTGKQDASDRNMKGLFLVHVWLPSEKIDAEFYKTVTNSERIAIVNDPKGAKIRNEILDRVKIVENNLRKLLLHVSDIVEDYYKYFSSTNAGKDFPKEENVIAGGYIDPITSYLTLEDEINIFGADLSNWNNRQLKADDLLELLENYETINEIKRALKKKIAEKTVWDYTLEHVLEKKTSWDEIHKDLDKLKKIRNKAAHFRVVTDNDLKSAKILAKTLSEKTRKKSTVTQQDLRTLQTLTLPQFKVLVDVNRQTAKMLEPTIKTYQEALRNMPTINKSLLDALAINQKQMNKMYSDVFKGLNSLGLNGSDNRTRNDEDNENSEDESNNVDVDKENKK